LKERSVRTFKTGGISVCFHCQRQLVRIKGGFIFAEIVDPDGHRLRVHKECQERAVGYGYRLPTPEPERQAA
jgi:hypothetical protein